MVNSIIGGWNFWITFATSGAGLVVTVWLHRLPPARGMLIIAGCISEVSSRFEETGGLYLYARVALGRFAGLLVGWLIWLTPHRGPGSSRGFVCHLRRAILSFPPRAVCRDRCSCGVAGPPGQRSITFGVKMGKVVSDTFTAIKVGILTTFILSGLASLLLHPELRVGAFVLRLPPAKSWFEALLFACVCLWRIRRAR